MPLSTLAGGYSGKTRTAGFNRQLALVSDFRIGADGAFSATAADCAFAGTKTQHGTTGIYEPQGRTSDSKCSWSGQLVGIVTPIAVNEGKATLGFQLNSPDATHTAVFVVSRN
ncbi:MAG: hypothetical protein V4582_03810 [Pseudomonadota bacterium]